MSSSLYSLFYNFFFSTDYKKGVYLDRKNSFVILFLT